MSTLVNPQVGAKILAADLGSYYNLFKGIAGSGDLITQFYKGADIASGATITPSGGNYFHVTGTTPITAIAGAPAGTAIGLKFNGAVTVTHNATSLALIGAANFTTQAGDIMAFVCDDGTNWREFFRAPVAGFSQGLLTTKGDLHGFTTMDARIAVGSDTQVLTADSTQAAGVKWAASGGTTVVVTKYQDTTQFSTSSASYVDITSMSIAPNVSNANNNIRYELYGTVQLSSATNAVLQIINSTDSVTIAQGPWSSLTSTADVITSLVSWMTQATGAKTVKGQMFTTSGTAYIGGSLGGQTTLKGLVSVEYR